MKIRNIKSKMTRALAFVIFCFITTFLFGQDSDAVLARSAAAVEEPSSIPKSIKWKPRLPLPIVALPENLLPHLAITSADTTEFQKLLAEKDTGIFKVWNDICGEMKIIDASKNADCLEYSDYAFGSQYSLGFQKYFNLNGNLLLSKNRLSVPQDLYQSTQILMDLGSRELSQINKKTKEVVELSKIKMIDRYGRFQMDKILQSAALKNNRIALSYPADLNRVFLLRSVFGDDGSWQKESLFAFQIVRFKDNIATIIWKKIYSKWA